MTAANVEALSKEIQRQLVIVECKNLIGKVMYYGVSWLNRNKVELWSERDDCLLEMPWGIYDGRSGIERCYLKDFGDRNDPGKLEKLKGVMMLYTVDTPVVVVDEDGCSARGLWTSAGIDTWREGAQPPDGYWRWGKYVVDFILEGGTWKIWKMRFHPYFHTKYDIPWTKSPAYDWAFFPVTPDRPLELPVYHYDGEALCPDVEPVVEEALRLAQG